MESSEGVSQPNEPVAVPVAAKPRRRGLVIAGVTVLVVLLAGAAFVGGRLLNQSASGSNGITVSGGPGGEQRVTVQLEPAKELPNSKPDVTGLFSSRKDNSIFVTQSDKFMVRVNKDGSVNTQTDGNGQQLEVVVTTDTTIYKDVTQPNLNAPSGNGKVQQQVAPGSLDEISGTTFISAWGERRGDRVIATVLVYSQPVMIKAPGP